MSALRCLHRPARSRLTAAWDAEYQAFRNRDLSVCDYVCVWVDGIHFNVRLEDDRLCTLVMIGVQADGTKELVGDQDGRRESAESRAGMLRKLLNLAGHWLIGLPVGCLLCFRIGWGVVGLWIGISTGLVLVGSLVTAIWWRRSRALAAALADLPAG